MLGWFSTLVKRVRDNQTDILTSSDVGVEMKKKHQKLHPARNGTKCGGLGMKPRQHLSAPHAVRHYVLIPMSGDEKFLA